MPGAEQDETPFHERMNADPPWIDDLGELDGAVQWLAGNRAYIQETDWLQDGRVAAYVGITKPVNTTGAAKGDHELTFTNVGPVGAIIAAPNGDHWTLDVPDLDALETAYRNRRDREAAHRMEIIPAVVNMLDDRQDMHGEEVNDYGYYDVDTLDELDLDDTEWFHLGRALGMLKMASLAHRVLSERLDAAYKGRRRWDGRNYSVIRERRTRDWPPTLPEGESA